MNDAYASALRDSAKMLDGWGDLPFFTDGTFAALCETLAGETGVILPPPQQAFAALDRTPPDAVRAVILGQDPYPTPGHANGLAFSVAPDVRPLPRSLTNIYKELVADIGEAPLTGDLGGWADNGVLLLNSALSVRAGAAGSHAKAGWGALVEQIIARVADRDGVVWILWGNHARARRPLIETGRGENRLILESAHPSPLSARRGFFGSAPFSRAEAHVGVPLFHKDNRRAPEGATMTGGTA